MKLIFLLILAILKSSIQSSSCTVYGQITKSKSLNVGNNGYCVYLDTNEFDSKTDVIEIYVTAYNGLFKEFYMYHGSTNTQPYSGQGVSLSSSKYYDHSSYSNDYTSYYDKITYYFKIPKTNNRYLYLSIPNFWVYYGFSYSVEIGVSTSLPLWLIIVIVCIVIIIAIISTIVGRIIRRRRRESYISPPADYQQPYSPMPAPGVPYY